MKRTFPILLWVVGAMLLAHVNALAAKPFRASPSVPAGVRDYLNPDTGRFWTMDSYEGNSSDPLSLHKYLYAHADPVNGIDPSGELTLFEQLKVSAITAGLFTIRWAASHPKTTFLFVSALSATGVFDGFPPGHPTPFDELAAWGRTLNAAGRLSAKAAAYSRYQGALLVKTFFSKYSAADHKTVFFKVFGELEGKVWVHHAVPQAAFTRYSKVLSEAEKNSLANLRGIPNKINRDVHLSQISKLWNDFYKTHPPATTTKQELLDFSKIIDDQFGHLFNPPIRLAPGATPVGNPFE